MKRSLKVTALALVIVVIGIAVFPRRHRAPMQPAIARKVSRPLTTLQRSIMSGARDELTWGTGYDPRYCQIPYPEGDVPKKMGACTDVVIRAYRRAGIDLQQLIHEDMIGAWKSYPRYRGLNAPDPNIDHRRVPNQAVYFRRHWLALTKDPTHPKDWQAGDIVEWKLWGRYDHTGILSDRLNADGFPLVFHNVGDGPKEEDVLSAVGWQITGHFRFPEKPIARVIMHGHQPHVLQSTGPASGAAL